MARLLPILFIHLAGLSPILDAEPASSSPKEYRGQQLTGIQLPIGGIGTGSIVLDGTGRRTKWFLWDNWKYVRLPDSYFAVRARVGDNAPVARAVQTTPAGGFEAMNDVVFRGEYPFGWWDFEEPALPIHVQLEAFNLLVPLDLKASGMPCAIFRLTAKNPGTEAAAVSLIAAQQNCLGTTQRIRREAGATMVEMVSDEPADSTAFGSLVLMAFDGSAAVTNASPSNAVLTVSFRLNPGETRAATFAVTWHFPNVRQNWDAASADEYWSNRAREAWATKPAGPHYANWWTNALHVARELTTELPGLTRQTRLFHDTFYQTTLPRWLLDGLVAQTAILRSPTCFWNRDGYFGMQEGYREIVMAAANTDGNCTHVRHYAQSHAHLFPALARTLTESDLNLEAPDGRIPSRHTTDYGAAPSTDGSCGVVLDAYREHLTKAATVQARVNNKPVQLSTKSEGDEVIIGCPSPITVREGQKAEFLIRLR